MKVFIDELSTYELSAAFNDNSNFINQIVDLLDFIVQQKNIDCYVNANFESKLSKIDASILSNYLTSPKLKVLNFEKKNNMNYSKWYSNTPFNVGEGDYKDDVLCQIADYQIDYETKCILISFVDDKKLYPYFVIRDKEVWQTEFTTIIRCHKLDEFMNWFNQKRLFNYEYKKHGVNGEGNEPNESKLLCSFEEAQSLLDKAFIDSISKHLFYFDAKHKSFIIFKNEGRGNWYHGYHVTPEDEKVQIFDKISTETTDRLRKLQTKKK
jgi:hypothetical protein